MTWQPLDAWRAGRFRCSPHQIDSWRIQLDLTESVDRYRWAARWARAVGQGRLATKAVESVSRCV